MPKYQCYTGHTLYLLIKAHKIYKESRSMYEDNNNYNKSSILEIYWQINGYPGNFFQIISPY